MGDPVIEFMRDWKAFLGIDGGAVLVKPRIATPPLLGVRESDGKMTQTELDRKTARELALYILSLVGTA